MTTPYELGQALRRYMTAAPAGTGGASPPPADGHGHLYRQQIFHLVPYGHFEEVVDLCNQLNAILQRQGGVGGTLWIPTVGVQNQLVVEFTFEDLGAFGRGRAAANANPEWTALVRRIGQAVVPGSVRTELWETAPKLA